MSSKTGGQSVEPKIAECLFADDEHWMVTIKHGDFSTAKRRQKSPYPHFAKDRGLYLSRVKILFEILV
ncbi:MAG: hypothetical protein IJ812_01220 [Schwartzia sp.]|nr:hypothetical protein [Schwartzia sp. (in: firmicutes)]MBR1885002.1 hypothetical protein [Schwartzia sp. (in: firmicutes)]